MIANNDDTPREPDTFDIKRSLGRLCQASREHKWLVLIVCLLTLGLTTVYVVYWQPIFVTKATLVAERDTDEARDTFYVSWNVFRKEDPRTEVELMTSAAVLKEVIKREELTYDDVYHPPLSHLAHLWGQSSVGKFYRGIKKKVFPPRGDEPSAEEGVSRSLSSVPSSSPPRSTSWSSMKPSMAKLMP